MDKRTRQIQQQRRLEAAKVITSMSHGMSLQLSFTQHGSDFILSNGTRVAPEVAIAVISDLRVVSQADGLFPSLPQTWIYVEPPSS